MNDKQVEEGRMNIPSNDDQSTIKHDRVLTIWDRIKGEMNKYYVLEVYVKASIADYLGVEDDEITPKSKFTSDLGLDSLHRVDLIMAIEKEYGVSIPENKMKKMVKVSNVVD